jgi:drug/metabolite transporter (DMT)-like permease
VCTAVTFVLFTWGVQRVEAARAGVISNVEPVIGSILGVVVLGERLGPWALVGGALLVAAALIATRSDAAPPVPPAVP